MLAFFNRIVEWFKSLFWKEEMELTLVGLQNSGKTTFVNVIAVSLSAFAFSNKSASNRVSTSLSVACRSLLVAIVCIRVNSIHCRV